MNSAMNIVTIGQKKCLIINYDFMQKSHLPAVRDGISKICFDYLYRKRLKIVDSINCEQYGYCHFIQEAWLDIKRATNLEVAKICFVKNPKEVIAKFDMNSSRLKDYTTKNSVLHVLQYLIPCLKGIAWFTVFGIIVIALVVIFSVTDHRQFQMQDMRNYTLQTLVSIYRVYVDTSLNPNGDRTLPDEDNPILSTAPITLHKISNITDILTKPLFNPTIVLATMFVFMVIVMIITSVGAGFSSTNNTINEKIAKIPKLNTEAREYFSNASDPSNTEYKGVKYFTYDVHEVASSV